MMLPDVNLLLYAVDETGPFHAQARRWWDDTLSSTAEVGLCYPSILGFIRLTTNRRVFASPLSIGDAVHRVQTWLDQPNVVLLAPTPRHWAIPSHAGTRLYRCRRSRGRCEHPATVAPPPR